MNRTARLVPALALSAIVIGSAGAGSAVAAKMITGKDIKNNTVASVDVKNSSLTGKDVKNNALQEVDLAPGVKQKLNEPAVQGYEVVTSTQTISAGSADIVFVACTGDKIAVGGGGGFVHDNQSLTVQGSGPREFLEEGVLYDVPSATHADAWSVSVFNGLANLEDVNAYVICVNPS